MLLLTAPPMAARAAAPSPLEVEQALDDLGSGDWILQWKAMRQLVEWQRRDAAPRIRALLAQDKRPWVRGRALVALAELLGDQVTGEVLRLSRDGAPEVRAAAVEALGILGSPQGLPVIAERLGDPAPAVRHQAVVALARVRRQDAWDTVAKHLADPDPAMVRHATRALAWVGTPEAVGKMMALLGHDDAGVRREAAGTLGQVRVPEAIPLLLARMAADGDAGVRDAAAKALAAYEPKALEEPLLAALRAEEAHVYPAALSLLARQPTPAIGEQLAALVRQPEPRFLRVLPQALDLLACVDADRYLPLFSQHLGHKSREVRLHAVRCVARCREGDPFALLKPLLADPDRGVRYAALDCLGHGTQGAPPGGIVAYLAEAFPTDDDRGLRSALDLLRSRITRDELPAAITALDPLLGGANRGHRDLAAKALERLCDAEARRRIAQAQGYLTRWMLLGPFPSDRSNQGFTTPYPPEREIDFAKAYESHFFGAGARFEVKDAVCGGEGKKSLSIRPPHGARVRTGTTLVAFPLELPGREGLKLTMHLGIEDGAGRADGVRFVARVGDAELFAHRIAEPRGWQPAEADLSACAGKTITLELVVDGGKNSKEDWAVVGEPRVVAGEEVVADLLALAPKARPRVLIPGKTDQLAWTPIAVSRTDGKVELHELMPPPFQYQVAYAVADLESPREQTARLWIETDDGFILWLNGAEAARRPNRGEHQTDLKLPAGRTRLLLKTCNLAEYWTFRLRLTDAQGRRAEGLRQLEPR